MRVEKIGDCTLILGDTLEAIAEVGAFDCLMTDPPYSSGGQFRGDRSQNVSSKYVQTTSKITNRSDFAGDTRDQRAFLAWASLVFSRAYRATSPGGTCLVFTDWRQLPTMTDAIQCGGYVWRNIVTWWKPGIRMQKGRFSSSAEYVVYGTKGVPDDGAGSPQNVIQCAPVGGAEKEHIAEKPVTLMQELLRVVPTGGLVCDPFMGSGTTLVACAKMGLPAIGIELEPSHFQTACERVQSAYNSPDMFVPRPAVPVQDGFDI